MNDKDTAGAAGTPATAPATGLAIAALLALGACGGPVADDEQHSMESYPPEATLYDPDGISSQADEFAFTMEPEGTRLYFNRVAEDGSMAIWSAIPDSDLAPAPVSFADSRYNDIDPFVSRDGQYLFFSSNRPRPGSAGDAAREDYDLWYALREGDGWGILVHAGAAVNSNDSEVFYSEAADGSWVMTRFTGTGGTLTPQLFTGRRQGSNFGAVRPVTTQPGGLRLTNPAISPDGRTLIMAGGPAGTPPDLYRASLGEDGWSSFDPLDLPGLATPASEFAPYICNRGQWLWFTSDRARPDGTVSRDLYTVRLGNGE